MRLEELEEMMTEEPDDAEAAVSDLVSSSNVEALAHVARSGRVHTLKLRAIDGLGEVGGDEASEALIEMLERANAAPLAIGGTEQRMEAAAIQARLMAALARTRGVAAPAARSQRAITEFIESCRDQ